MCYPCIRCCRCGKYDQLSPLYVPPPRIICFGCGGEVDLVSGACLCCGKVAFSPSGKQAQTDEQESGQMPQGEISEM